LPSTTVSRRNELRIRVLQIHDVDLVDGVGLVRFARRTAADDHDAMILRGR
jgi:hypothetical protein